ncbi:hypothetical protein Zmor_004332 [Zophobas morio]|uniref:DNA topoisomerase n=1 Tax=Zophobas morio TaxID=2755281 RepID=A0AA38HJM4_9CUCU|nr:hypothetical protein Zmor_004332 [Zophobas morio]
MRCALTLEPQVYKYEKWTEAELPNFEEGQTFTPSKLEMVSGSTTAPSLLTEAELISLMDANGIGTDATIAEHIAKILAREYAIKGQAHVTFRACAVAYALLARRQKQALLSFYTWSCFGHRLR